MTVLNSTDVRIEEKASSIESVLEWLGEDLEKVDQEFRKNLKSGVPIISAIGEHLLLSGGKRFRPTLLLLSAKLCGYQGEHHISLASLIEFIHTATLLHDEANFILTESIKASGVELRVMDPLILQSDPS